MRSHGGKQLGCCSSRQGRFFVAPRRTRPRETHDTSAHARTCVRILRHVTSAPCMHVHDCGTVVLEPVLVPQPPNTSQPM